MQQIYPQMSGPLDDAGVLDRYPWPAGQRWLRANMVASIDGAISGADGQSGSIGTAGDKRVFRLLRASCDVIIVGAGTVAAEGYRQVRLSAQQRELRAEQGLAPTPTICVVTNTARLAPDLPLFEGGWAEHVLVATSGAAEVDRVAQLRQHCRVLQLGEQEVDLPALLSALAAEGMLRQLTEGGPRLLGALADTLDDLCVSTAPMLVASQPAGQPGRMIAGAVPTGVRPARLAQLLVDDGTVLARWLFETSVQNESGERTRQVCRSTGLE